MYGQPTQQDRPAATRNFQAYSQALDAGIRAESKKDYDLAEKAYLKALSFVPKLPSSDASQSEATVLRRLGNVYGLQRRFAEAERTFRRLLDVVSTRPQPDDSDIAWALFHVGLMAHWTGRHNEGEESLNEAMLHYRACIQRFGSANVECLTGLASAETTQGSFYVLQGKWERAEPLIEHVMALPDSSVDPASRYTSLQAYAFILESRGRLTEAEKIRERAALYRQQASGQQAPLK
jgi:Flp pilus assembly protein TadD